MLEGETWFTRNVCIAETLVAVFAGLFAAGARLLTTTTLTEDVSNNCQSSGPVGVSDSVMTPRKNVGNLVEW